MATTNYSIKVFPEAVLDIQSISEWYEERKVGLGKIFKVRAVESIDQLQTNPEAFSIRYAEIRCIPIEKFPYLIIFTSTNPNEQSKY